MSKKLLSLFLAVVMLALAVPAAVLPAFAAEETPEPAPAIKESWTGTEYTLDTLHLGNTKWDATAYFFVWFNAAGEALANSTVIVDTDVLKINPALIEKGIIAATDTVQVAFAKWKAYMLQHSTISFPGPWTVGNVDASGNYAIAKYETLLNGVPSFHMNGDGKVRLEWDTNLLVANESTAPRQYDKMYSHITSVVAATTVVSDIALNKSQVNATNNNVYTYENGAFIMIAPSNIKLNPGANDARRNGLQWTSSYTGYASITIDEVYWHKYGDRTVKFSVLHNGTQIAEPIVLSNADNPTAAAQAAVDALDIAVFPGDTITLVIGQNGDRPIMRVKATISVDTSRKPPEAWTGSAFNATENYLTDGTERFFRWYDNGVQMADEIAIPATAVCKVNPQLYEKGIIDKDDTVKEAFDKWAVYLKENSELVYNGAWEIDNVSGTTLTPLAYYDYYNNRSPFLVYNGTQTIGCSDTYWIVESGFDNVVKGLWNCIARSLTGAEVVEDVALPLAGLYTSAVSPAAYQTGGMMKPGFKLYTGSDPKGGKELAYTWTSHGAGIAKLNIDAYSARTHGGSAANLYNVLLNGKALLPDYMIVDPKDAASLENFKNTIASLEIPVFEGDKVSIVFARLNGAGNRAITASITAELDTSRVPVVYKKNGEILQQFVANVGEPVPALTNAGDFGLMGYRINGEFARALPETVEGAMIIEDYAINSAASITITSKYVINVFVEGGEGATGAGVIVDGKMINGVKQADGTFKVAVLNVNANKLRVASVSYIPYQVYGDEYRIGLSSKTVSAMDLLKAYVNGNYDATTKALAQGVLDYSVALNAFLTGVDASANVKLRLRGEPTIAGVSLSGKNEIYLGTLKYISTGEVPKYISANQDQVFVADPTLTEADKVKIGYEDGVNPTSSEYKFAIKAVTLNLEERIGFAFRIVANKGSSLSDLREGGVYKLQAFDGVSYAYYDAFLYEGADKASKAIVVDGVPASRYHRDIEFTMVEEQADGTYAPVGATMTYSVKAYAVQTYRFGDWGYKPMLAQALFRLGVLANEYVAAHPVA